MNKTLEAAGMTAITMPSTDMYDGMQRGIVDGVSISYGSATGYKIQETSKYSLDCSMGAVSNVLVINKDSWNKLPKDIQDIIDNLRDDVLANASKTYDGADQEARDIFTKSGCEIYKMPEADRMKWIQSCKLVWDEWVSDMNKKGLPGTALYNDFTAALAAQGAKLPF